jgi:outer membrane biogenesis lipoprotein LolB
MKALAPLLIIVCAVLVGCASTTGTSSNTFPTEDTSFQSTPRHSAMAVSSKMISPLTSY